MSLSRQVGGTRDGGRIEDERGEFAMFRSLNEDDIGLKGVTHMTRDSLSLALSSLSRSHSRSLPPH